MLLRLLVHLLLSDRGENLLMLTASCLNGLLLQAARLTVILDDTGGARLIGLDLICSGALNDMVLLVVFLGFTGGLASQSTAFECSLSWVQTFTLSPVLRDLLILVLVGGTTSWLIILLSLVRDVEVETA